MTKVLHDVPFYPQKWDLGKWKALGFASHKDAEYWEKSCCGILCLQMANEYYFQRKVMTFDLIQQGLALNAYTDATGWSHVGLVQFAKRLGIKAQSGQYALRQLANHVRNGGLAVVSIKWGFQNRKSPKERLLFWKKYGGHLALVIGAEWEGDTLIGLYVHHTSIREGYNWPARLIPLKDFKRGYTGRGILLSKD